MQDFWQERINLGFIGFEESLKIVDEISIEKKEIIELGISDAFGYLLAEDIVASDDLPAAPTSAMDGYALCYEDMALGGLEVVGDNPAGKDIDIVLKSGSCIKTFTGSLMPKGADTLIPIENVTYKDGFISIDKEVPQGFSVRSVGENYHKGELLISKGSLLDFIQIGMLAALNISKIKVYAKPKVGVLASGSELLDLDQEQTNKAQIRSSNHYTLQAIAKKYGGDAENYGCIKDDKESIMQIIKRALAQNSIVVTTGGVSVGDYDFVKDVVKELGFEVLFHGVKIKPGQHIMLARKGDQFILALPGFAYSATVTALLYLLPLLAKFTFSKRTLKKVRAILQEPFCKRSFDKSEFSACNVEIVDGKYFCNFRGKKEGSSAILNNLLGPASALLYTHPQESPKKVGESVEVLLFD